MTINHLRKEVYHILQKMGISRKAIKEDASFQKDLGLDSLDFAELVLEFETTFHLEIPILEIEKIQTIEEAIQYLMSLQKHPLKPCLNRH